MLRQSYRNRTKTLQSVLLGGEGLKPLITVLDTFSCLYCTLPGHVEQGEERFQLRWDFATDEVCLVTWMRFHFPTIFWLGWSSRIRDRRAGSAGSHAFQCKNRKGATRLARTNARFFALMTLLSLPSYTLANYANGRRGETSIDPKGAKKTTGLPKKKLRRQSVNAAFEIRIRLRPAVLG